MTQGGRVDAAHKNNVILSIAKDLFNCGTQSHPASTMPYAKRFFAPRLAQNDARGERPGR